MAISSAHVNLITHTQKKIKAMAQPIAEISIILISAHFPRLPKYDNLQ